MKPATADVLRRLERAGATGIHSFSLSDPECGRVHRDGPKRVSELGELGYRIDAKPEQFRGSWGVRYTLRTSDGNPARPSVKPQARAGGAERPGIDTPSRPGLASEGDGASAGGLNSPPPAAPRPTRHPAQSMKQWSTPPDDREGWGLVRDFDGRWWWELRPPLPAQTEMAA